MPSFRMVRLAIWYYRSNWAIIFLPSGKRRRRFPVRHFGRARLLPSFFLHRPGNGSAGASPSRCAAGQTITSRPSNLGFRAAEYTGLKTHGTPVTSELIRTDLIL